MCRGARSVLEELRPALRAQAEKQLKEDQEKRDRNRRKREEVIDGQR